MSLPTPAAARETVAAWLAKAGVAPGAVLIGFQAGASSRGRMWPQSHFAALAQRLEARYPGVRFLLTGSPDEAEACRRLAAAIGPAALSSAGEVSIDCLPVLMTQLRLLVTGDTGALHVAVAVGTPTVSLFAVSDPRASGPAYDADRHTVIQRPCERSVRSKSDDQEGMRRISVDDVATAVEARFDAERDAP
jgi:ADP-heptose:LPS heptosyltransferase